MYQDPNGSIAITTLILIGSIAAGLIAAGITAYRSYQYSGKIDWGNTIFTGLSWFLLAYTLGTSAYALYTDYCNYRGYTPISEVHFNSSDSVLTVGGSSTVASSQISKMVSGVMPNRINHIMQAKHAWNLVGANDWTTVSHVINTVLTKGTSMVNDVGNIVYSYVYKAYTVEVTTRVIDGVPRIVDAWVKTK